MTERITWMTCPCGDRAAVGWIDETPTEVHCIRECELTQKRVANLRSLADPPPGAIRREP